MSNKGLGYIRLVLGLWEPPNSDNLFHYDGIEILRNEFFSLSFTNYDESSLFYRESDAYENILSDLSILYNYLKDGGHTEVGLYEIYGIYSEEWTSYSDYWGGGTEWDFTWEIKDIKIKKYNRNESKSLIEEVYATENRYSALEMITKLDLTSDINRVRNSLEDDQIFHSKNLFIFDKQEVKIANKINLKEDNET